MDITLPYMPERSVKPREKGVTMMMDKGLSTRQAQDFIDASGHLTDIIKLGFGTSYVSKNVKEKVKLYHDNGLKVYLGGTLFEAFVARGKFDDYRRLIDSYGIELTEVSDGSIIIPHDEKLNYISTLAKNYQVMSEVGSKEEGHIISPAKWVKMMSTEIEAGSWKVIAEGRESGSVGIFRPNGAPHTVLINRIIAKVDPDKILWEAPQKKQQVWFIKLFGADVNLGNIAHNDMIPLECLRLGLRGDTFFENLPDNLVEALKQ